jgi:hypothetical protein
LEYSKQYHQDNKEKAKEQGRQNYIENREVRLEYGKQYYIDNKDDIKQYREENCPFCPTTELTHRIRNDSWAYNCPNCEAAIDYNDDLTTFDYKFFKMHNGTHYKLAYYSHFDWTYLTDAADTVVFFYMRGQSGITPHNMVSKLKTILTFR